MTCRISTDGKLAVCGGPRGKEYYYFTRNYRYILFSNSCWYEPNLILKRKRFERIDLFKKRAKKKLGFIPGAFSTFKKKVLKPMLAREMKEVRAERKLARSNA